MFSSSPNYTKLKTNLRLAINRLKLIEKKKSELAQKARKEIADYIQGEKAERAKIRVEHIIREDYMVEAMEIVEMYCDLLLARFGLITQMIELDDGLSEAVSSLIWVAPRMQTDIQELKIISELLTAKYGKQYAEECRKETVKTISEKLKHKMSVQSPPKILVEKYLIEIAKIYNVNYEPDPQIIKEGESPSGGPLIDFGPGGSSFPHPPGFVDYPQPPPLPNSGMPGPPPFAYPNLPNFDPKPPPPNSGGFVVPPAMPPPMTYNIPPGQEKKDLNTSFLEHEEMNNLPPAYDSISPDDNLMNSNAPKPQPRSKFPPNPASDYSNIQFPDLPDLPSVPSDNMFPNVPTNSNIHPSAPRDEIDFDDLTKRFEELKKKK